MTDTDKKGAGTPECGRKIRFASDYMEGAHPAIMERLVETNLLKTSGYGTDEFTASAKEKIRKVCAAPDADVWFLSGGTQTNAAVIGTMLKPYQCVIAAASGHISGHEAGAIEFGGHKVLMLPGRDGKLTAEEVRGCVDAYKSDENRDHLVMPAMVYVSHPTESGTLYSRAELAAISGLCRENGLFLYLDGARLAYALASPENELSLPDIASMCDAFYIGGTKCGALFGEAAVFPKHDTVPHFFTMIKQRGALLAKGRIPGIQFDVLFTDGLYERIGEPAIRNAARIKEALAEFGYELAGDSPTNQIFVRFTDAQAAALSENVEMAFWEKTDKDHVVMRIATSWATTDEDTGALIEALRAVV